MQGNASSLTHAPLVVMDPFRFCACRMVFWGVDAMYRRAVSDIRAVLNKAMDIVNEVRA